MGNLLSEIAGFERRVWDALVAGDKAADLALLHPDFIGVYSDGFANRDAHSGQLDHGPGIRCYDLDQITTVPLGEGHALITYRATFQRGAPHRPEVMFVS